MTISHQILPSPAVPGGGTLSVYVCIKKIGVCVYFLISAAEIRYRHDLVRLCFVSFLSFSDENPAY